MKMKALHRPVLCTSMKIIQRFKFFKKYAFFHCHNLLVYCTDDVSGHECQ